MLFSKKLLGIFNQPLPEDADEKMFQQELQKQVFEQIEKNHSDAAYVTHRLMLEKNFQRLERQILDLKKDISNVKKK
jgi:hypothetical protein